MRSTSLPKMSCVSCCFQAYWVRKTNVGVECLVAQTPIHFQYTESAQQRESHRNGSGTSRREERRRHRRDRTKTDRVMLKNVLKHLISLKLKVAPEMTSSG